MLGVCCPGGGDTVNCTVELSQIFLFILFFFFFLVSTFLFVSELGQFPDLGHRHAACGCAGTTSLRANRC